MTAEAAAFATGMTATCTMGHHTMPEAAAAAEAAAMKASEEEAAKAAGCKGCAGLLGLRRAAGGCSGVNLRVQLPDFEILSLMSDC